MKPPAPTPNLSAAVSRVPTVGAGPGAAGGSPSQRERETAACAPSRIEQALVGALLDDQHGTRIYNIARRYNITTASFADPASAAIWRAAERVHAAHNAVAFALIDVELHTSGDWEKIGGMSAVEIIADAADPFHAEALVAQLAAAHRQRKGKALSEAFLNGDCDITATAASWARLTAPVGDADGFPRIENAATFTATAIETPPEIVAGVVHKGSKLAYGGPSKANKTWCLLDLCLSVANGVPWLGFRTHQGCVLYINLELQSFALQRRLAAIATGKKLEIPKTMEVWNLRGYSCPLPRLLPDLLKQIEGEGYALIVVDPIYKTLDGRDENSAGDIAAVCNELETVAVRTGAAVAFGAHFAKGSASGKSPIDRISGSGVWARDPDSIIVASPHEDADCFTVEMTLRNFPQPSPFVVRWQYPLMVRDESLDPARLRQPQRHTSMAPIRSDVSDLIPTAAALVTTKAMTTSAFKAKLYKIAETVVRVRELFNAILADGRLEELHLRGRGKHEAWIGTPAQIMELHQQKLKV